MTRESCHIKCRYLDFKLSPCSECCVPSSGWFTGVWFLYADVSEHCSIFIGRYVWSVTWLEKSLSIHTGKPFPVWILQLFSNSFTLHTYLPMRWNRQSVPKRRHIKFRLRGITQKKAYNMSRSITTVSVLKHRDGRVISPHSTPLSTALSLRSEKCQGNKSIGGNEHVSTVEIKPMRYELA